MNVKIVLTIIVIAILLRFFHLSQNPPSLYWDEASLAYNAYSILKTGNDEHGAFLPITNFAAYGDYKPPVYIYSVVPAIALFGLNEFSVRFPSAFFGVLTVLITYFLAKKLFGKEKIAHISALFLAISPWHIQLSRAGFESNMALFLSLSAIWLFISASKKPFLIIISGILFVSSMYTFTGQRLFVPLIVLVLVLYFKNIWLKNIRYTAISAVISLILFLPLLNFSKTIEGRLRFDEVTIFKDLKPINDSIEYRQADEFNPLSDIIHNRRLFFAGDYLTHYFDAFNPTFLFISGDQNPRFSSQISGQLFLVDIILLPTGLYFIFARKLKAALFILIWLLISPLGPATARETPHALRMAHIIPTFQIISAAALFFIFRGIGFGKIITAVLFIAIILQQACFINYQFRHYPSRYSGEWQYGYKEAVLFSNSYYHNVNNIIVSEHLGRPYIYFALYSNYDPARFQKNAKFKRDQFFFYNVEGFDKYVFTDNINKYPPSDKNLYITSPQNLPAEVQKLKTIYNLKGDPVFDIGISQI